MKFNVRKVLLAGTAIVAASAFGGAANAATLTLTGASTWGTTAPVNAPTAGDDVVMTTFNLTINNTLNTAAGAITATTGDLLVTDSASANIAQTIGSFVSSSTGDFTITGNDAQTANIAVTVTNDLTTGGALSVTQTETSTADTMTLSVGDDLTVTGTTTLTAGGFAGANSAITVTDDAAFTGAVTVTAATAGTTGTLTIGGDATFTGGVNLVTNDNSIMVLNGTGAQAVSGVISGAGDINVTNTSTSGVTFTGDSTFTGELTVNNDTHDQKVTFNGDFAGAIALGDNVTADTVTANFNGTTQAISGGITGGAAETVNVNFLGGSTITLSGAATSGIDTAGITGSTTVTTNQNFGATTINVASGSTLATTANTITATTLANAGTLQLGGGSVTAAITGAGLLDVNSSGTITGAITQGTADIAAGATLTHSAANYTVGTTNFSGAGVLALTGGAQTLTGNFTNTTDGQGSITVTDVAGTVAFVGNVGASTSHSLSALTVAAGANAVALTTTGNLYVDTTTIGNGDTLTFLGSSQTVSGAVNGTGAGLGTIVLGDGTTKTPTVTFDGIVGGTTLSGLTVNDNSKAIFNNTATFAGALSADAGTVQIASGKTFTAATQTDADVTTWNVGVSKSGGVQTNGTVALSGDAINLANDTVNFVVSGNQSLTTGASVLNNVFQGTAPATIAGATVTDTSYLFGFTLVADTNNVDVTITQDNSFEDAAGNSNEEAAEILVNDLSASTNTQIAAIRGNLIAASDEQETHDLIASIQPTVNGGDVVGAMTITDLSLGVSNERMASLRTGSESGMATGNVSQGLRMWGQAFGSKANQDNRDGIDGYDADTWGGAVGLDTENAMNDHSVVGVALSYGNTSVDSDGSTGNESDVDSYQVTLYGDMDLGNAMYLNGQLAYAWGNVETDRYDIGGVSGLDAHGEYDSSTYAARAELGRDYQYDKATITPHVMGNWVHFDPDSYDETGAGGANLHVAGDSLDIIEAGIGADVSWMYQNADGSYVEPKLSAGYRYNFGDDQVETTSTFAGGGDSFRTEGADPSSSRFNVGASIRYFSTDNWDLTAGYNYDFREDYGAHSGMVRAAYKF